VSTLLAMQSPMRVQDPTLREMLQAMQTNILRLESGGASTGTGATSRTTVFRTSTVQGVTQQAMDAALADKEDTLAFTPEDQANKGQANGYAPLDADALIGAAYLPDIAAIVTEEQAGAALGGQRLVKFNAVGDVVYVDSSVAADANLVIGMTTQAAGLGGTLNVLRLGNWTEAGWAWTPGAPLFVSTTGQFSESLGSAFVQQVGVAQTATTIAIGIRLGLVRG